MSPDKLRLVDLSIAKEFFNTVERAVNDENYFMIDNFPAEHKIKWTGVQFGKVTANTNPDVRWEKGFVILKTATTGIPLSIIHPNPDMYKVKADNSIFSVHYILYDPVRKLNIPPLFLCKDETGKPQVLTREMKEITQSELKLDDLDGETLSFIDALKDPNLEKPIDRKKVSNWAEFINYVLKEKLVIPFHTIPPDSSEDTVIDVYMNDILPTVASLLYADAYIKE